jgi:hypothetical protein
LIKNEYKLEDGYVTLFCSEGRQSDEVFEVYIDAEDLHIIDELDYKVHVRKFKDYRSYYAMITVYLTNEAGKKPNKYLLLHRLIMNVKNPRIKVDHINHNTLDNRKTNLRLCSNSNNNRNRERKNSNNKSGYRNVCWLKKYNKWCDQLQINGKNTILGKFDDVDEAGTFAEQMRQKYYGEYAGKS